MKISTLIKNLKFYESVYGDIEVVIQRQDTDCEEVKYSVVEDNTVKLRSWPY